MNRKPSDPIRPGEPLHDMYPPDSESQDLMAVLRVALPPIAFVACLILLLLTLVK